MTSPSPQPVLIVQDKRPVLTLISSVLASAGITDVDIVLSGAEALRRLHTQRYGLVLCERHMHPISGLDVRMLMSSRPDWAGIPFICILSSEREGDEAKRKAARITTCLPVPFTVDDLQAAIRKTMVEQAAA